MNSRGTALLGFDRETFIAFIEVLDTVISEVRKET